MPSRIAVVPSAEAVGGSKAGLFRALRWSQILPWLAAGWLHPLFLGARQYAQASSLAPCNTCFTCWKRLRGQSTKRLEGAAFSNVTYCSTGKEVTCTPELLLLKQTPYFIFSGRKSADRCRLQMARLQVQTDQIGQLWWHGLYCVCSVPHPQVPTAVFVFQLTIYGRW